MTNTFDFIGGDNGEWKVISLQTVCGLPLEKVSHLSILPRLTTNQKQRILDTNWFYEQCTLCGEGRT